MHSSYYLWQFISNKLANDEDVILMYVLESNGSSPGRQGFAMAIAADGTMHGSIGGGIMEHKFVEMCRDMLSVKAKDVLVKKQVHDKAAAKNQSGMICSGDQTIFICPLAQEDIETVQLIEECLSQNKNATLVISRHGIRFVDAPALIDYEFKEQDEQDFVFKEKLGYKQFVSIIGGGHCALALSRMLCQLDFYITVYDDRDHLNTIEQNIFAHKKVSVKSYSDLAGTFLQTDNQYIVVMTFGYRSDDLAIRALLKKPFKYFGVLGSANKIKKLFSDYIAEGYDKSTLEKLHAPVGLPINSRTPEEIAISIAAQIIQVKNSN